MLRSLTRTALLAAALLAFPACDSNDDDGGGGGGGSADPGEGSTTLSGDLSGSLNGSSYAVLNSAASDDFIYVVILGANVSPGDIDAYTGEALGIALFPDDSREGEYRMSLFGGAGTAGNGFAVYGENVNDEDPEYASNSGTVRLTRVTDSQVIGTFDINLANLEGGGSGRARGSFNATVVDDLSFGGDGEGGDADLPNCANPSAISLPGSANGSIESSDCQDPNLRDPADYYAFTVPTTRTVEINQVSTDDVLDPYLALYNSSGSFITSNDDGGDGTNSRIQRSLPAGTYVVAASTFGSFGSYTLTVE